MTTNPVPVLCKFWSHFFQRGDGWWIAYCSKEECDKRETERPGWRENGDFVYADGCNCGFGESSAELSPCILKGKGGIVNTYYIHHYLEEGEWDSLVEKFYDWMPLDEEDYIRYLIGEPQ